MEKALGSSSPPATARPWRFIWKKSRLRSRRARMRSFFSIRRDGSLEEASYPRQHHPLAVAAEIA
jgi:hypothetical protein